MQWSKPNAFEQISMENTLNELIYLFGTVIKQTKCFRIDNEYIYINDQFSPVMKQTKWAKNKYMKNCFE